MNKTPERFSIGVATALRRGVCRAGMAAAIALVAAASAQAETSQPVPPHPERDRSLTMTTDRHDQHAQNTQTIQKLFEAFNHDDLRPYETLVAPDYVGPQGDARGPAAFRAIVGGLRTAFPDIHYIVDDLIAGGDQVAVRWHWTGTHKGAFRGHPPTGRSVTNSGLGIFRLRGGRIVAASLETDRLGFLQQIGVIPEGVGGAGRPPSPGPASPPPRN
jgi:steroid delta-isomerase-like uncharacterized protein